MLEEYIWARWFVNQNGLKEATIDYCISNLMIVESDGKVSSNGNESIIAMALAMCSQNMVKNA